MLCGVVSGNEVSAGGEIDAIYADLELTLSLISGNTATSLDGGGGVYMKDGDLDIGGTTITHSTSQKRGGGNLESPGYSCPLDPIISQIDVDDPMLSNLGDFGYLTKTVMLLLGSPAIDHGTNTNPQPIDQRTYLRNVGLSDVGSVGRQPLDPSPIFLDGFESGDTRAWQ